MGKAENRYMHRLTIELQNHLWLERNRAKDHKDIAKKVCNNYTIKIC